MIYPSGNFVDLGGGKLQHHLYIDTAADVASLPGLDKASPGSDAYCLDTQDVYILNGDGVWEVQ
jgi:hypothetical protein